MDHRMTFAFTRERRLWTAAVLIVLAIYFTLGPAVEWLRLLQASGWGTGVFLLGCCLLLVFIVTRGMTAIPSREEVTVAIGIAILYSVTLSYIKHPEERIHVIMYGVVALVIYAALLERSVHGGRISTVSIVVIAVTTALGSIDEVLQFVLPNRVFDVHDILYNILASVMAVISNGSLRWVRGQSV
ncbi:MAG: VanZ family protein [Bacteroidota bacterium]|nr:VanZ family protein [Bacteroidota bacterium]MDE2646506.1 VanZ family protein [Bacteroidota bacterium]